MENLSKIVEELDGVEIIDEGGIFGITMHLTEVRVAAWFQIWQTYFQADTSVVLSFSSVNISEDSCVSLINFTVDMACHEGYEDQVYSTLVSLLEQLSSIMGVRYVTNMPEKMPSA